MSLFSRKPKEKKPPLTERLKASVGRYTKPIRDGASIIKDSASSINEQIKQRPERDLHLESEMQSSFLILLQQWGMQITDIPAVTRGLKIEATAWSVVSGALFLWVAYCAYKGDLIDIGVGLIGVVSCLGIASTRYWRRSVLNHQRYVPYTEWLGFKKGNK